MDAKFGHLHLVTSTRREQISERLRLQSSEASEFIKRALRPRSDQRDLIITVLSEHVLQEISPV